jgi:glycosyltransferase involved in cell wall biosynthesis
MPRWFETTNGGTAEKLALQNDLVLLPALNEAATVGPLVRAIRDLGVRVLVVDDGSRDATADIAREAGADVLRHEKPLGKGAALATGFRHAVEEGYDAVVTFDADGQHEPAEVLRFFDTYNRTGIPVLIGSRIRDRHLMPLTRRLANRWMSFVLNRRMRQFIADTQNGFRLYQTDVVAMVRPESTGFAAESEILLLLDEIGIRMGSVPVSVQYKHGGRSHIHPLRDLLLFLEMLRKHRRKPLATR